MSPKEAGVNIVYVRKTSLATPRGSGVRCDNTLITMSMDQIQHV